jgi:putative peptide maturation system protein
MNVLEGCLLDTLALLEHAAAGRWKPAELLERVNLLARQHPDTRLQVVWAQEAYDDTFHYDALLETKTGVVSLSFCPDGAKPWALRGIRRWSDGELLRVNDRTLKVTDAMAVIDFIWDQQPLVSAVTDYCLLRDLVDAAGIEPEDHRVQAAFDRFRLRRGLVTADATHEWLARHGFSLERLEVYLREEARLDRYFEQIAGDGVDALMRGPREELDLILFAYLDFESKEHAEQLVADLTRGRADFFSVAAERCAALRAQSGVGDLPLTRSCLRFDTPVEYREKLFSARPGDIVGPVTLQQGHRVFRVLGLSPASGDDNTRERAKRFLFEAWLHELRSKARIEWQWGRDSSHPSAASPNRLG